MKMISELFIKQKIWFLFVSFLTERSLDQKIYEWPFCPFAKMIHSWENQFGKRTEWSVIYFLIYVYLNILAQSQILVISLYNATFTKKWVKTNTSKYINKLCNALWCWNNSWKKHMQLFDWHLWLKTVSFSEWFF